VEDIGFGAWSWPSKTAWGFWRHLCRRFQQGVCEQGGSDTTEDGICSVSGLLGKSLRFDLRQFFSEITADDVSRLIGRAKNKTCNLDPVPTWIVKEFADQLSPFVSVLFNASLRGGTFPSRMKHAMVIPGLKKAGLDQNDLGNYRPISNLSFLSKLLERCAYEQITEYLHENDLMPENQSAYRTHHSTETALLDVLSGACAAADAGQVTLLGLLDLSAAFDTIDHGSLIERLRHRYGITGDVLGWMTTYLTGQTQAVYFNGEFSTTTVVTCGIPQGSVLGPLNFILYSADVLQVIAIHGFSVHGYADDLQIYDSGYPLQSASLISRLSKCVEDVNDWMARNRLCLNPSKTELIWLGSARQLHHCPMGPQSIAGVWITPAMKVRDLGLVIDADLSMTSHVDNIIRICYFHIRQLRAIRRSLTTESTQALVRAFVHSRLDYCNGALAGLPGYAYKRLQAVLRSAARLCLRLPSFASVSDAMRRDLHWLNFPNRVTYKLCTMAYMCQHEMAPVYLRRYCVPTMTIMGRAQLRSASTRVLSVPRTRTVKFSRSGFYFAGPSAWNSLPVRLRQLSTFEAFKKDLKTYLFDL